MKRFTILLTLLSVAITAAAGERVPFRHLFNDGWFFTVEQDSPLDGRSISAEGIPNGWQSVDLPHTPRLEPVPANDQWQGICFYAKRFEAPKTDPEALLSLTFEGAMNEADVWLNGQHIASHLGGYLPFTADLTDALYPDKENLLVVRLDNRDNPVTGPKPLKRLDFNTYGGLYRNVWLTGKALVHLSDPVAANRIAGGGIFVRTEEVSDTSALVRVKSHIRNLSETGECLTIVHRITGNGLDRARFGGTVQVPGGGDAETEQTFRIPNPALWSPETPALYTLETELYIGKRSIDREQTRFGIRKIVITPEGLRLNGKARFLRGVNRHQEYPYIGYALSDNAQRRDAWKIKQAGFDYVRTSHYPSSPAFLDACDEYGIFVLEPILGWQYFGDERFTEHALHSSREMIRRDRNHPCILAWELSINEIRMPEEFIDRAVAIGHEEYPGQTYIVGWMKYGYDIYIEARQHRKEALYSKPLIVSEYGDWEYFAMNAGFEQERWSDMLPEERFSRQARGSGEVRLLQQATNVQEAHNDNLSTHAFADGYWAMFDYSRGLLPDLELSGASDVFRLPKYAAWFFRSQRDADEGTPFSEPMVFIASEWKPGISRGVRIFSNCEEVELTLDGRSLGRRTPDTNTMSNRLPHPPFSFAASCEKPGTLTATGYIGGKIAARHTVATPGKPAHIRLKLDESGTPPQSGCNDVLFVYATVTDSAGNVVTDYDKPVQFTVSGDAKYVYTATPQAEAGIAPALLRIGQQGGTIHLAASTDGIVSEPLKIQVQPLSPNL